MIKYKAQLLEQLELMTLEAQRFCQGTSDFQQLRPKLFFHWLLEDFITSEKRILEQSNILWPKNHIKAVSEAVLKGHFQAHRLLQIITEYTDRIQQLTSSTSLKEGDYSSTLSNLIESLKMDLKILEYWDQEPLSFSDTRFLFPDKYLQFVLLPKLEKIKLMPRQGDDNLTILCDIEGIISDLRMIPKAHNLRKLLRVIGLSLIPKETANNFQFVDLNPSEEFLYQLTLDKKIINDIFCKLFEVKGKDLKVKGYKRGEVPMSIIRETLNNSVVFEVTNEIFNVSNNFLQSYINPNGSNDKITCLKSIPTENDDCTFFVVTQYSLDLETKPEGINVIQLPC